MKELEILSAFMIGGHDLNNMRSTNDTVLITDTERKGTRTPAEDSEGK